MSATLSIFSADIYELPKQIANILQKSEGPLDFGFHTLLTPFLGVEVVWDDTLNTQIHIYVVCKLILVIN